MKKGPVFTLLIVLLFLNFFHTKGLSQTVLKGGIQTIIPQGEILEVYLNTPINFYFSQLGDEVAAFTKEDIYIGDKFYIPKGSQFIGIITNVKKPTSLGRDGAFEIDFNKIITKNNIEIPIYASITTDTKKGVDKVADILTYDSALITYGAFHGAIAGVQYGGIPLAIASHGISVLGGVGLGASFGIIGSLVRKGKIPTVITNQSVPIALKSNFYILGEIPDIEEFMVQSSQVTTSKKDEYKGFRFYQSINKDEIEITINNLKKSHSKTHGNYLVLEIKVKNKSEKTLSLSDIVLVNDKEISTLHPDLFLSGIEALKSINAHDEITTSLTFLITDKKDNYSVAIIDPLDNREILRIPLEEIKH